MWPNGYRNYSDYGDYDRHDYHSEQCHHTTVNQENAPLETQTLQVTFKLRSGKMVTKLLTVTDVEYSENGLVEFWNGDKLLLMIHDDYMLEALDVDELLMDEDGE